MNRFFNLALGKATAAVTRRSRLLALLPRLAMKLKDTSFSGLSATAARDRFFVFGRLIKAYATGQYREVPWKSLLLIVAAVIYFINPLDLVPDLVPLTGLTDDFAILVWVYGTVSDEIEKFLLWERNRVREK